MSFKTKNRTLMRLKRRLAKPQIWIFSGCIVILLGVMAMNYKDNFSVDTAAYKPLLSVVAKGESGGNYNAYYGNSTNEEIHFTEMTIREVLQWQEDFVRQGNVSSAVGKYQIIQPTLIDITSKLGIDHNATFDEAMQDKLAIALMERRGSLAYVKSEISREEFATNLAKEWAALPNVSGAEPHRSYYAGDGINKANITADEVYSALDSLHKAAQKDD